MDAQGPDRIRPYVEKANATFPTAVDPENILASYFGFKVVPNGVFLDEAGIIRYTKFGGFDIRQPAYARLAEQFATSQSLAALEAQAEEPDRFRSPQALEHFRQGLALYRQGKVAEALTEWRKGVALEPDNYIIRKQIWAVEHPERFYRDTIDFEWQREQMARGL